jgi:hypothetical protein
MQKNPEMEYYFFQPAWVFLICFMSTFFNYILLQ